VRDTDVNLYRPQRLLAEFGPFRDELGSDGVGRTANDIVGDTYRKVLAETTAIVAHQWRNEISRSALKGFLFHGGVGIGKTTMARRLAYELCRIFKAPGLADHEHDNGQPAGYDHSFGHSHDTDFGEDIVMVIVDGADIARGRYGDSEEQLRKLFDYAREGEFHGHRHDDDPTRRTVLLFDDVESLFLERGSSGAKEWHFSQNSVFFHAIDELDTARTAVLLTTNRIDLVDAAIIDRFLPYEFSRPPTEVLTEVAWHRASLQKLADKDLTPILDEIERENSSVKSLRDVERTVTRAYVASIVGQSTNAAAPL